MLTTPAPRTRVLLDSTDRYDAHLMGYDGPRDASEDGEGLSVTLEIGVGYTEVRLNGPDGEVRLSGAEIRLVAEALAEVVAGAKRAEAA